METPGSISTSSQGLQHFFSDKLFHFCYLRTQLHYIIQGEVNFPTRELGSLVDSLCNFLKAFDQAGKCLQSPLSTHKIKNKSTKSKHNLSILHYNDIIEHPNRQYHLSVHFGNKIFKVSSIKKFE